MCNKLSLLIIVILPLHYLTRKICELFNIYFKDVFSVAAEDA